LGERTLSSAGDINAGPEVDGATGPDMSGGMPTGVGIRYSSGLGGLLIPGLGVIWGSKTDGGLSGIGAGVGVGVGVVGRDLFIQSLKSLLYPIYPPSLS
tara:strand:+ start:5880 stop:6176 length:297 start_codon:yes stop_codon:yes gene_type:complete